MSPSSFLVPTTVLEGYNAQTMAVKRFCVQEVDRLSQAAPKRTFASVIVAHILMCDVCTMYNAADTSLRVLSLMILLHLCKHAGTARLNGVNLSLRPGHSLEACGKLGTVKVETLARLNRAEGGAGSAPDTAGVVSGLVQRAVLLCLLAVAGERLRQRVRGGGRVGLGSVVYVCDSVSAIYSDALRGADVREGVVRLPRKRIMG